MVPCFGRLVLDTSLVMTGLGLVFAGMMCPGYNGDTIARLPDPERMQGQFLNVTSSAWQYINRKGRMMLRK
jgi:hypothetical protein